MARREGGNTPDDRMNESPRDVDVDEVRGVADEGGDEFEDTEDLDEEEDEGTL
jgi:hypothetical protein